MKPLEELQLILAYFEKDLIKGFGSASAITDRDIAFRNTLKKIHLWTKSLVPKKKYGRMDIIPNEKDGKRIGWNMCRQKILERIDEG